MCPAIAPGAAGTTTAASPPHPLPSPVSTTINSQHPSPDFFLKDGRKFCVGDCALFQAGSSPPFIGIIRWFTPDKEEYFKLGVNWLYRPSDIKLAKGIVLKAAPNEVFYSFRTVETSAGLLLHPCKVAFLHKGVELPSGVSSFVCWRVYDTTNKCLWWLNETDYIDGRQEVDQLLEKTQIEMHAALQPGGRSPKQLSGHLSSQKLNSSSDSIQNSSIQNSSISVTSHTRSKKRGEKGDQGSESMKRERSSKADDGDSGHFRLDSMIKAEIAKITDKGGLTNNDAVEKLVQLMQLDRGEKKIDFTGRVLLADVIASTDRNDCLGRFVQLRGIPMLDDWLQEAHKGKNGDGTSPKESDKSVEELLLALLRALDKLPVNLNALQTCNIGKSVNHLRSHKNMEIQKKARSLVDTWKKRVDVEMKRIEMAKLNDAKAIGSSQAMSWPGKPGFSEVSIGGSKRAASTEVAVKSATNQLSTCKSLPVKSGHGDSIVKLNSTTSGSLKLSSTLSTSVASSSKEQTKVGATTVTAELPSAMIKDEKSSSSSQSQNNSQSCSNDYAKALVSSGKEDVRNSASCSTNTSKITGGTSRHRRTSNGFVGTGASGVQKDSVFGKYNILTRNTTPEKAVQSGQTVDRTVDAPVADHGNSQRLVVRLPNPGRSPGRSPARSASGGFLEDPSVTGSRVSSPGVSEKNEHVDHKTKLKIDVCQVTVAADVNTESCQSNDVKSVVGSDHGYRSSTALLNDENNKSADESRKATDALKAAISSEPKSGKPIEASSSSINVLIESSVQCKEDIDPIPGDCTERLFTMMASEKMSNCDMASSDESPGTKSPAAENPCAAEVRSKFSSEDIMIQIPGQPEDNAMVDPEKNESTAASFQIQDDIKHIDADLRNIAFADSRSTVLLQEMKSTGEHRKHPVSAAASCKNVEPSVATENKPNNAAADKCLPLLNVPANVNGVSDDDSGNKLQEEQKPSGLVSHDLPDCKQMARSSSSTENKPSDCVCEKNPECSTPFADGSDIDHINVDGRKCEKELLEDSSCTLDEQCVDEGLHAAVSSEHHLPSVMAACPEDVIKNVDNPIPSSSSAHGLKEVDEPKKDKSDGLAKESQLEPSDDKKKDHINLAAPPLGRVCSSVLPVSDGIEDLGKDVIKHPTIESDSHEAQPLLPARETELCIKPLNIVGEVDEAAVVACSPEASSAVISPQPDSSAKHGFDLNEGLSVDEGNMVEPVTPSVPGCSSAVYLPNLTPFAVSPMSSTPFIITVAAPAKGPFVPPETLLKSKGEGGWKGSAATSAFRPAEPRKILEMPLGTSDAPLSDAATGKQCRHPLNFDLNVPDERVLEDITSQGSAQQTDTKSGVCNHNGPIRSSGGLDLDLNRVDESTENGQLSASVIGKLEVPLLSVKPACRGFPDAETNVSRDFDLNNGPGTDEVGAEQLTRAQNMKGSGVPFLPSLRMNNNETRSLSSWFPSVNSYSAVAIPSFLPDRGDQPYPGAAAPGSHRILGSAAGIGAIGSDLYRGPVLSSSAMTFSPAAAFSYAGFPFGSSFPLASTSFSGGSAAYIDSASGGPGFPAIPSPLLGPAGAASSSYIRPYVIGLSEGSTSGGSESSRKWVWQGLDLNTGPGSLDVEGREDRLSLTSRQLSVANSQALAEEQARMYQTAGGGLKRKEPEGGWDAERFTYKQPPWQ